ncbi:MAG: sulfatase-like hydrolase/transferase [Holophagales bacterium]|nr:sulfatase-like hydrolase/transferase [Holophagales bacterium]MYF96279.1 sulfatase-like hydrolase/transferase [Holophagales bacterium]
MARRLLLPWPRQDGGHAERSRRGGFPQADRTRAGRPEGRGGEAVRGVPGIALKARHAVLLAALAVTACGPAGDEFEPAASRKAVAWPPAPDSGFARDVVLITIDTLRADATGFAGNAVAQTPHLDRLAAEGWVFERTYAHNVMTLPSHVNLLTSQLPYQHGVRDNAGFVLPERVATGAEAFLDAGFRTAAVVAAFPLDARYGLDRGFELYDDSYPEGSAPGFAIAERGGAEVVAAASAWWTRNEGERRFLWAHFYEPHAPYEPPEPFASRFAGDPYLGEVAAADDHVGRLLARVAPAGAAMGVLVVVTSDHGESLGEHGESTHGLFAYDATLKVPLVFWAEELAPARLDQPVRHIDVLPTMLEAAGIDASALPDMAGRSLWRGPAAPDGAPDAGGLDSTYFEALQANLHRGWAPLRGVIASPREATDGDSGRLLKYVSLPDAELYDLEADPTEARNLHDSESRLAAALADLLPEESEWPPAAGGVTEEERRALESLGYLSSSGGAALPETYGPEDDPKRLVELDRAIQEYSEAFQAGYLEEAERLARRAVEQRPQMGLGYTILAQALLEQGEVEEALMVMIDAERRRLASASLHRQLALTLSEVGRAGDAVRLMERYADSNDPEALNVFGLVLAEAGMTDRARGVLERSIEIDGRNPVARQNLALTALHGRDWPVAEIEAREALALNPELALAWNYLGMSLFNQRRVDEALEAWQRSVEVGPGDLDVLYNLATTAARTGRREIARPALERFLREASVPGRRERYAADLETVRTLLRGL